MVRAKTQNPPRRRLMLTTTRLREQRSLKGRVDRERGIIFGVKVVGRSSPNTHGVRGVDGTDYTLQALQGEASMLEGINCNVDHPPRSNPNQERSAYTRFAWLEEIEVQESGIYGNLHFLDPADPLAVKMMNAAESKPDAFALSHNAVGKGEIKNRRYIIHEITEVHSVDIVADGGTNRSLFEGLEMSKVRVCEVLKDKVLPALNLGQRKRLLRLLETSLTEARSPLMEAGEDGKDHRDHMYTAMRACEDAGNEEGAAGIHKLLHPGKRIEEEEEPEKDKEEEEEEEGSKKDEEKEEYTEEGMGEEGPDEPGEHNEGPDGKGGPATKWESRQRRKLKPGEVRLNEARALAMCRTAGVEATADVMEAIQGANFEQAMAVINLAKRSQGRPGSAPRSTSPLRGSAPTAAIPKDLKQWAESLRG